MAHHIHIDGDMCAKPSCSTLSIWFFSSTNCFHSNLPLPSPHIVYKSLSLSLYLLQRKHTFDIPFTFTHTHSMCGKSWIKYPWPWRFIATECRTLVRLRQWANPQYFLAHRIQTRWNQHSTGSMALIYERCVVRPMNATELYIRRRMETCMSLLQHIRPSSHLCMKMGNLFLRITFRTCVCKQKDLLNCHCTLFISIECMILWPSNAIKYRNCNDEKMLSESVSSRRRTNTHFQFPFSVSIDRPEIQRNKLHSFFRFCSKIVEWQK